MRRNRELEKQMGLAPQAIQAIELVEAGERDPVAILRKIVAEFAGEDCLPVLEEAIAENAAEEAPSE